jgi:hypothetical protein
MVRASSTTVEKYYDKIKIIQEIWRNFDVVKGTKVYHTNRFINRDESFLNTKMLPKKSCIPLKKSDPGSKRSIERVTTPAFYNASGYYNSRVTYIYDIHKNLVPIKV